MEVGMAEIAVSQEMCTRCGACVAVCTGRVYRRAGEEERIEAAAPEECWSCGQCVAVCPADAIQHSAYPVEECPLVDAGAVPTVEGLVAALRGRRSLRMFRERPVERWVVEELVEVGRWAPSAGNGQPVDWLAFDGPAQIAALSGEAVAALAQTARMVRNPLLRPLLALTLGAERVRGGLEAADSFERLARERAQGEDPIFFRAPVVLVAHVPEEDYFGRDDAVYAAYNVMLVASAAGLGTCHVGYFMVALERSQKLRGMLGLSEGRRVEVVLTLGYPRYRFRRMPVRRRQGVEWKSRG
jgi:nitroreductase/NAD-dependent dihydropyrimidine dehydrogenase PreA subunit